jgi:signal transduction histidine kinase
MALLVGWVAIENDRFADLKSVLITQMRRNALDVIVHAQQQDLAVVNVVRKNTRVEDALTVGDYNKLLDTTLPMMQLLSIRYLAIYKADGSVALQAHDPAVFGHRDELFTWLTTGLAENQPVGWTVSKVGKKLLILAGGRIENLNGLAGFVVAGTLLDADFLNDLMLTSGAKVAIEYDPNMKGQVRQDDQTRYYLKLPTNISATPLSIFLEEPDKRIHDIWLRNLVWGIVWLVLGGVLILVVAVMSSRQLTIGHANIVRALAQADSVGRDLALTLKRVEEQKHHLDLIVRCAKVGSFEWNNKSQTAEFSAQLIEMLGCPPDQDTHDWKIENFIWQDDRESAMKFLFNIMENPKNPSVAIAHESMDFRFQRKDGVLLWMHGNAEVLWGEDGQVHKILASFIDISPLIAAQEKTRLAMKRQEQLNDLRTKFVSMTSHEFRTPLAGILSSAQLLKYYREKLSTADSEEILSSIEGSVARMTGMLDKVLLIGKAETGMLEFKPESIDLHSICSAIVDHSRSALARAGCSIKFVFDAQEKVGMYDRNLLHHIFENLLSNAVKYSPDGGEVVFRVRTVADEVEFSVSDQGIGIPAEDLPDLFNSFQRASNVGKIQGTGLGLVIVKNSVDLHGGTISVQSPPSGGTVFIVSLPVRNLSQG